MTFVPTTRRALLAAALTVFAATGAHAAGPKKLVLLINGTTGDKSFFDSAANGMKLIAAKYGDKVQVRTIEMSYDQSKWQPTLDDIAGQDWDAIITGTYQMTDLVTSVAPDNPKKTFIIYDAAMDYSKGEFKNVYSITYKQNEGSYLAGMAGAGVAAANGGGSLGFLGGLDIPVINDFLAGYVAGAQAIDPKAKVAVSYIGSFDDAAKGKELALAQYRTGTEIGFNVAGTGRARPARGGQRCRKIRDRRRQRPVGDLPHDRSRDRGPSCHVGAEKGRREPAARGRPADGRQAAGRPRRVARARRGRGRHRRQRRVPEGGPGRHSHEGRGGREGDRRRTDQGARRRSAWIPRRSTSCATPFAPNG